MTDQTAQKYINKIRELEKRVERLEQEPTPKENLAVEDGINRDDAIAEYNAYKITISENVSPDCMDAIDLAFRALEHPEKNVVAVVPCGDAISRHDTLQAIIKRLGIKNESYLLEAERTIYQQILAMPSVEPKAKTGHWIDNTNGTYTCDRCGGKHSKSKYCPMCGTKMEVDDGNNN